VKELEKFEKIQRRKIKKNKKKGPPPPPPPPPKKKEKKTFLLDIYNSKTKPQLLTRMMGRHYLNKSLLITCNKFQRTGCKNVCKNGVQHLTLARETPWSVTLWSDLKSTSAHVVVITGASVPISLVLYV